MICHLDRSVLALEASVEQLVAYARSILSVPIPRRSVGCFVRRIPPWKDLRILNLGVLVGGQGAAGRPC